MCKTLRHKENLKPTEGEWDFACDSYGKVQHSRKACVFTCVKGSEGERLVTVAARIPNWDDARFMAGAKELYSALKGLNHMGGDDRGGYCICPLHDGSAPDEKHATSCADARKALRKVEGDH